VICTDFPTKKANEMMQEIMRFISFNFSFLFQKRILKDDGVYIQISCGPPENRLDILGLVD